jgi:hypothetical protein
MGAGFERRVQQQLNVTSKSMMQRLENVTQVLDMAIARDSNNRQIVRKKHKCNLRREREKTTSAKK